MKFNLTEWALNHRSMVVFLILVIGVGGTFSFTRLGQLEDPNFSVPSMTAMIYWPGATAQHEAWYQARKKFSDLKLELPEGVIGPIFNDEYGDVAGIMYAVKAEGIGQAELSDIAEVVKRRMLKVPMVKKVDIYGKQAKKVYVEFSHQRLAALGITPVQIAESLRNQNSLVQYHLAWLRGPADLHRTPQWPGCAGAGHRDDR